MASLSPGTRVGGYEIVALLGAGGMGEVYRARDPRLGRDVALKRVPPAVAADPERLARFEREARVVAALNHPNIVTIHSIEEAGTVRFLTMELVEGQSLDKLVPPGGLPVNRVLELAIPLADALVAAHDRGIVHRDLKPANVMVARDGRLKVLDFGLARIEGAPAGPGGTSSEGTQLPTVAAPLSASGVVVGTLHYMAPEQLRGAEVGPRADLFSLGVLLFELTTGQRPFGGDSHADVSSAILRDTPPPIGSVRADVPRDLERVVARCLEKDVERRFQTARDVRNELDLLRRELASGASAAARRAAPPVPAPSSAPSLAVLPFANRSREADDEYFAEGLADELQNVLARIKGLRVAARTSSAAFKGKEVTIADVGRALGVASVLEGSVRKSGNRVRISVQLVGVTDGYPMWSETYDRTLEDIFAVQDDIAQAVVKELRATLLGESPDSRTSGEVRAEVAAAARGRGESTEAQRLFLQGRHLLDRLTAEDVARAVVYFEQAIALDPHNAKAWAQLSHARWIQSGYDWIDLHEGVKLAREAARRAIELEPTLAAGYVAMGDVLLSYDWDWDAAEAMMAKALELEPHNTEALRRAAETNHVRGRLEQSLEFHQRAVELDPLSSDGYLRLGRVLRLVGRLEDAEAAFRKSLDLSPQRIIGHFWVAIVKMELGHESEAFAELERERVDWVRLCGLGILHGQAGRLEQAREAARELDRIAGQSAAYQVAAIHAHAGDADATFEWLERSYDQRDPGVVFFASEPGFRRHSGDPRWATFMRKMRLAD